MPPKKKQKTTAPAPSNPNPKPKSTSIPAKTSGGRRSKLAKDNDISATQEAEVKEVWRTFARDNVEGWEEEKEGVIETGSVGACLRALDLAPTSSSQLDEFLDILDPDSTGYVTYPHFLEIAALQFSTKPDPLHSDTMEVETEAEVTAAMYLFTNGVERNVTIEDLRRVRGVLKEDGVSEDVLRAMVLEANGGVGVGRGVGREGMEGVMRRCGILR